MDSDGNWQRLERRLVEERWRVTDVRFRFLIDPEWGPLPGVWCLEVAPDALGPAPLPQLAVGPSRRPCRPWAALAQLLGPARHFIRDALGKPCWPAVLDRRQSPAMEVLPGNSAIARATGWGRWMCTRWPTPSIVQSSTYGSDERGKAATGHDRPHRLVAQDPPVGHPRDITLEDVQVGTAELLWLIWGVALGAATLAYFYRRRGIA
jgi:hypothetical protein